MCAFLHVCVLVQLSHSWGQALGALTLPLREVLAEPGLVLDRWLSLDGALPESQILLKVMLKVQKTYCLFSLQCIVCHRTDVLIVICSVLLFLILV